MADQDYFQYQGLSSPVQANPMGAAMAPTAPVQSPVASPDQFFNQGAGFANQVTPQSVRNAYTYSPEAQEGARYISLLRNRELKRENYQDEIKKIDEDKHPGRAKISDLFQSLGIGANHMLRAAQARELNQKISDEHYHNQLRDLADASRIMANESPELIEAFSKEAKSRVDFGKDMLDAQSQAKERAAQARWLGVQAAQKPLEDMETQRKNRADEGLRGGELEDKKRNTLLQINKTNFETQMKLSDLRRAEADKALDQEQKRNELNHKLQHDYNEELLKSKEMLPGKAGQKPMLKTPGVNIPVPQFMAPPAAQPSLINPQAQGSADSMAALAQQYGGAKMPTSQTLAGPPDVTVPSGQQMSQMGAGQQPGVHPAQIPVPHTAQVLRSSFPPNSIEAQRADLAIGYYKARVAAGHPEAQELTYLVEALQPQKKSK